MVEAEGIIETTEPSDQWEASLIARLNGEGISSDAFAALYDHYFSRVYNYVTYRVRDLQAADDLTAQIFERVLGRFHQYDPSRGVFGAWLFAIARSVVIDYIRAQRRRRWLSFDRLHAHAANIPDPESLAAQHEAHAQLLEALKMLNDRERELIALRFGGGLSNRQIAGHTSLTESNVGVILHRALRKLRQRLENEPGRREGQEDHD